jgi:DNA helicase-2/ATP-dependent DNA helicase PcrA
MNLNLILGGPGCGKTTRLIEIVKQELATGTSASRIAFVAFTKAAAEEAKRKAAEAFSLDPEKDLPWFRTIHSLAYAKLGLGRDDVMARKDWKEFAEFSGYPLTGSSDSTFSNTNNDKLGDQMLRIVDYADATGVTLQESWELFEPNFDWWTLEQFAAMLKEFKDAVGKVDFGDMLTMFPENCDPIDVDVAIIDEGQDLTHSQWNVVNHAFSKARQIFVAGDDDQAIYKWAGADVQRFLSLSENPEVLPISHRLPKQIHALASTISSRISHRYAKHFSATDREGSIEFHMQPYGIDFTTGTWLLLARSNYMLFDLESHLKESGIYYATSRGNSVAASEVAAIKLWEDVRSGKRTEALPHEVKNLFKTLDRKPPVIRNNKAIPVADLNVSFDKIWHEALTGIEESKREYYISCLRRGEKLTQAPRVRVETIHGVKGAEADNVLLLTDLSAKTEKSFQLEPDTEHRVFYVGVTRAKRNLHIVAPQTSMSYYIA